MKTDLSGYCLIHKPEGITSNDALKIIKKKIGIKKMGHGGTLDPFATGLLFVVVGESTKFLPYISLEPKGYAAVLRLGSETDTLDKEGAVIANQSVPFFDHEKLKDSCQSLLGERHQLAPAYSAKKIEGQRSYDLARKGIVVERKSCLITISKLQASKIDDMTVGFDVLCSGGTYVRVIGEEIARNLGTVGHLTSLHRSRLGEFTSSKALSLDSMSPESVQSIETALPYPCIELNESQFKYINVGRPVSLPNQTPGFKCIFFERKFLGLCSLEHDLLKPVRLNVVS